MYEFSVPFFNDINTIEQIIRINKTYEKGNITSFFFALPLNAEDRSTFEQVRTFDKFIPDFKSIEDTIKYSQDNNIKFIYLLNSPIGFSPLAKYRDKQQENLSGLLEKLKKVGCYDVRITNYDILNYVSRNFPEFKIHLSTSTEYTMLEQFRNAKKLFPCITEFIPSYEVNKNFHLLKNLRKSMPDTDVELIADEGCINGCPFRIQHPVTFTIPNVSEEEAMEILKAANLYRECYKISGNYIEYLCKAKVIFPWEVDYYGKIDCKKFKLVGRNVVHPELQVRYYDMYLKGIEEPKSLDNVPIKLFLLRYRYAYSILEYKVKDIKKYLPSIKYFIKHGKECHYKCGVECTYCMDKAKKIEQIFKK